MFRHGSSCRKDSFASKWDPPWLFPLSIHKAIATRLQAIASSNKGIAISKNTTSSKDATGGAPGR